MKNLNITMSISMDKKYRTTGGSNVTLLSTNAPLNGAYKIVGVVNQQLCRWSHLGTALTGNPGHDLVEVSEYEDFKIDDPVMVRDNEGEEWVRRYFAGVDANGFPLTWCYGATSWTNENKQNQAVNWRECRKPTAEELKVKSK